jgi:hypothetical protein
MTLHLTHDGQTDSLIGWSRRTGLARQAIQARMAAGWSVDDAISIPIYGTRRTHGESDTHLYTLWKTMKARCGSPGAHAYADYGGRGIRVCDRWRDDYTAFRDDMGPRPSMDHSVDRIDGDGDYEPGNCRWATSREQVRNRACTRFLTWNGEIRTISEWSELTGICFSTIATRVSKGWPDAQALSTPVRRKATA